MKKQILHLGMIAACAASSSAQAQISDQEKSPAYNLAVHQAVVALLNAQVIAAEKAYNATVHNDPVFTSSHYDTESMIAQSLEWPTADLAETWLSQNSN